MKCKSLHSLPKFASKTQRIQVGNGQCFSALFTIPVVIDVHWHRFEIYTLVLEIHKNVDLVLGIKNVFKLEGVINTRDCCFKFLNRFVLTFLENCTILKPNEQKLIRVKAPFIDEISGLAIVKMLDGPPVLHMSNKTDRFHLYSDTSKFATGSALWQIQDGKPKLIAYVSKRLPEAARSYSITDLELCSLAINIASFSHLLKRVDFDTIVDLLSLMHIIKSKVEPATTRIKRLLELISLYSFNLYYMKGKDMILSDFLSRQKNNDSNPQEIIPISFNMCQILDDSYYIEKYLIQTWSQSKSSGIKLLEVHGMGKNVDPNLKPEKQHTIPKQGSKERPCIGQGRAGSKIKRQDPINQ